MRKNLREVLTSKNASRVQTMVAAGTTDEDIAGELGLSVDTIAAYVEKSALRAKKKAAAKKEPSSENE
jgi:DNA-binding NarL/FixJ family response regulator